MKDTLLLCGHTLSRGDHWPSFILGERVCAGNYSEYERNAQEKQQHMQRLQDGLNKKKSHMEKSIQVSLSALTSRGYTRCF